MRTTIVAVRCAGERTADLCVQALGRNAYGAMRVLRVAPFVRACEETFRVGAEMPDADLLVALDADVVLASWAIEHICGYWAELEATYGERLFRLDCRVLDRFRGPLCAGLHVYRNSHSAALVDRFSKKEYSPRVLRPESEVVMKYKRDMDLEGCVLRVPVGLHDYAQWPKDAYRKGLTRAAREGRNYDSVLRRAEERKSEGADCACYWQGLVDGRAGQRRAWTDAREDAPVCSLPEFSGTEALTAEESKSLLLEADELKNKHES